MGASDQYELFFDLASEGERSAVIIGTARLDELLGRALTAHMTPSGPDDRLLGAELVNVNETPIFKNYCAAAEASTRETGLAMEA